MTYRVVVVIENRSLGHRSNRTLYVNAPDREAAKKQAIETPLPPGYSGYAITRLISLQER